MSLWEDVVPQPPPRPPLPGDRDADVAVVGGGFTGLWTAYYLLRADPTLRVHLVEAARVGHGASGRNGGWCSALFPLSRARLAALPGSGPAPARAQHQALRATVDEVGRVLAAEGIDADWKKGGTVVVARTPAQLVRARRSVAESRAWGDGDDELRLLDAGETQAMIGVPDAVGGTFTPDCAALQPLALAQGLARVVEDAGGRIWEGTRATELATGQVRTTHGTVRAATVLRCTEGWTARLPREGRTLVPVYSLVVATEPLGERWRELGLADRQTFSEHRNLVVYGQRTADGRLVFGGRGAPYHFGSSVRPEHDHDAAVWRALRATVLDLLPALQGARFTHAWGGPLGIPRDWCPSVGLDPTGMGWAGGYVGDGVAASNLAGRTLRDLVLGRDTDLTRLPWVQHRSPRWEPEPWRWLGVNAGLRLASAADRRERRTSAPSRLSDLLARLTGG